MGDYVEKILNGKPSDLPIQRPERFDLEDRRMLRLSVPPVLLATANEVIE